ncbi:hypothetical protein ABEY82_15585 [Priestia megaterium]
MGVVGAPLGALLTAFGARGILIIMMRKMMLILLGITGIVWAFIRFKGFKNRPEDNQSYK